MGHRKLWLGTVKQVVPMTCGRQLNLERLSACPELAVPHCLADHVQSSYRCQIHFHMMHHERKTQTLQAVCYKSFDHHNDRSNALRLSRHSLLFDFELPKLVG